MLLGHDFLLPQIDPRVYKEAKTLIKAGFTVGIVCLSSTSTKIEKIEGIKVTRIPDKAFLKDLQNRKIFWLLPKIIWTNFLNTLAMLKTISQEQPHFIHANDADTLLVGTLAKIVKLNRPRLIYDSHEIATEIIDYRRFRAIIFLIEKTCSYFVNGFITVNEPIRRFLTRRYPRLKSHSLTLINSPLLNDKIAIEPKTPTKVIKFVFQGNLKSGRLKLVEEIAAILAKNSFKNWDLTFIVRKNDIPKTSNLHKNSKIVFKDLIADRKKFLHDLSKFDIGIVPAENNCLNNYYSLPNKLFDYMEAGVATLATNLPVIKKIADQTQSGYIFNPKKKETIIAALDEIFRKPSQIKQKKLNGRKWIEKKYNWSKQERKLVRFYQKELNL